MSRNGNLVRVENMQEPIEEVLKQIEGFEVDGLSANDKARIFKALQKS